MLQKYKKQIDSVTLFMAVVIPMVTVPQLLKIWIGQNANWVSIITWSVYFVNAIIWLLYWIVNNDKKIITMNILLTVINLGIVVGILVFK